MVMERRRLKAVPPLQSPEQSDDARAQSPAPSPLMQFIRPSKGLSILSVAHLLVKRSLLALSTVVVSFEVFQTGAEQPQASATASFHELGLCFRV
jgi:hypothetical protein